VTVGSSAAVAGTAVGAEFRSYFDPEDQAGHATDFVAGSRSIAAEEEGAVRSRFVDLHEVLRRLVAEVVLSLSQHLSVEVQSDVVVVRSIAVVERNR